MGLYAGATISVSETETRETCKKRPGTDPMAACLLVENILLSSYLYLFRNLVTFICIVVLNVVDSDSQLRVLQNKGSLC